MNNKVKVLIGILIALVIVFVPFIVLQGHEFAGTDDQAVEMIGSINKDYKPWFESVFEISDEMEGLFFTLQAVLGALVFGFCLGKLTSRNKIEN